VEKWSVEKWSVEKWSVEEWSVEEWRPSGQCRHLIVGVVLRRMGFSGYSGAERPKMGKAADRYFRSHFPFARSTIRSASRGVQ
jgi:hypothetical protein